MNCVHGVLARTSRGLLSLPARSKLSFLGRPSPGQIHRRRVDTAAYHSTLGGVRGSMSLRTNRHWRFAPLNSPAKHTTVSNGVNLDGIVFDVDGTLCKPQNYMFAEMRQALGIPKSVDILGHIQSLPVSEQDEAMEKIRVIERRAMLVQTPQPGLSELMTFLEGKGIRKAICTRNFDEPVSHLLRTFIPKSTFSPIITRSFTPPKPDPAGILHIATNWDLGAGEDTSNKEGSASRGRAHGLIMVGDSIDDMVAGSKAGAYTVLLVSDANQHVMGDDSTDLCISRLDDLIQILELGRAGASSEA